MGARAYMGAAPAADHAATRRSHYGYIGRPERASPGEGYPAAHAAEQSRIVAHRARLGQPSRSSRALGERYVRCGR